MKEKERAEESAEARPEGLMDRLFTKVVGQDLKQFPLVPLFVLFGLNLVDEFDVQAFNILGPNIRDAFGISNEGLGNLRAAAALPGLLIPFVGFLGDRVNRIRFAWIGALIWGVFSVGTGLMFWLWALAMMRIGSGIGKLVNFPVHISLLSDYYPQETRGRVYGVYRAADGWAIVLGPALAGLVAWALDWRWAFALLAIPTFVLALLCMRLTEPVRGFSDDAESAMAAAEEPFVPFGRAIRWLYSVPTLKRIFLASFASGLGGIAYGTFSPVFLEEVFGVQELGRGIIASTGGPFLVLGTYVGGRITDKLWREKSLAHVTAFFGFSVVAIAIALIAYALSPTLPIAIVVNLPVNFTLGLWLPAYLTIVGLASPARIRSLGISYAGFFFTLGIVGLGPIGAIIDRNGERTGLVVAAAILLLGGLLHASAAKFANADVNRSLQVLQTEAQLRHLRLTKGGGALLVVQQLDVGYDGTQVLFGVDLEVEEGELVALLGTNGAGKSTLLKAISGLVHPLGGAIYFDGKDTTHYEPEETAELGVIQMPGGKSVFPSLTVKENLDMAGWLYHRDVAHMRESMAHVYEIFPVLEERLEQQAGSLSGGEQQMLSLAQAFIAKPRLLMIDELSLGLAPLIVQQLLKIVEEIHQRGTTIILVEQSVNVALTVAKHCYFMEKGEIRFDGSTEELLERTDILRSVFLEGAQAVVGERSKKDGKKRS